VQKRVGEEKHLQNFAEIPEEKNNPEDINIENTKILHWILKKVQLSQNGFILLRIREKGEKLF
jgi:hypothetical protein